MASKGLWNVVSRFNFSSILQLWYVEVRISRSIPVRPLKFEKTRVDCTKVRASELRTVFTRSYKKSKRAQDVYTTSSQRRCNVMTLHPRCGDVVYYVLCPRGYSVMCLINSQIIVSGSSPACSSVFLYWVIRYWQRDTELGSDSCFILRNPET